MASSQTVGAGRSPLRGIGGRWASGIAVILYSEEQQPVQFRWRTHVAALDFFAVRPACSQLWRAAAAVPPL